MQLADLRKVKYFPELLPESRFDTVPVAGDNTLTDLRRFDPLLLTLDHVSIDQSDNVLLRIRADAVDENLNTASLPLRRPVPVHVNAKDFLSLTLRDVTGVGANNFRSSYGFWVRKPTIAEKLRHGFSLTGEEEEIARALGIRESVEKGVLPLPVPYQIDREYAAHIKDIRVFTRPSVALYVPVAPDYTVLAQMFTLPGEILVLRSIAGEPGTAAENVSIIVDRDEDADYLTLKPYGFPIPGYGSSSVDWEMPMFIPALKELRIKVQAAARMFDYHIRVTIWRVALTNTMRVRFGLAAKGEVPDSLWQKVAAGVL